MECYLEREHLISKDYVIYETILGYAFDRKNKLVAEISYGT